MKNLSLLVWISQLGLSVALPLAGFVILGVWLHRQFDWGVWVVIVSTLVGLACAVDGLRYSLKAMDRLAHKQDEEAPTVAYNDHD